MAQDLSGVAIFPYTARFQVDGVTGNKVTEIILPRQCSRVQIGGESHITKIAYSGSDGAGIIGSLYVSIPADNLLSIRIGRGSTRNDKLYVASANAGTWIMLILEEL